MAMEQFYLEEGFPFHSRKLEQMKEFLKSFDLTYDSQIQYSVFLKTASGKLAGCGSRHENTLKCIAINPAFQGEGCLQLIMTQLVKNAFDQGISHLFLFTNRCISKCFPIWDFIPLQKPMTCFLWKIEKTASFNISGKKPKSFLLMKAAPSVLL